MVSTPKFMTLPVCALGLLLPALLCAQNAPDPFPLHTAERAFGVLPAHGAADDSAVASAESAEPASCDTPQPDPVGASDVRPDAVPSGIEPAGQGAPPLNPQPKRILGVMPNFRAVSAGAIPPPPTARQAFKVATQNSFDYSSFVFVGITSLLAEGSGAHKQLGTGLSGYGGYYWRGLVDKTDGNYFVIFVLPTVFHQDERYYAMGKGGFWKRAAYSSTRVLITPDYHGHNSFNASELLGRAIAQGISLSYYPAGTRTSGAIATKYGYAIGRDVLTNVFREFWPDIAVHVLHRHP
jgi:hypothetical protein